MINIKNTQMAINYKLKNYAKICLTYVDGYSTILLLFTINVVNIYIIYIAVMHQW